MAETAAQDAPNRYDMIIVGAGFAGMYMLHRANKMGLKARVIEAGSDVGGTWYWNRYPGARCDVESLQYCYKFDPELEQEWNWSERYSPQEEILDYARHVSERYDLRKDIQFDTRVASAKFDEGSNSWTVTTEDGESFVTTFCVMATGCLSAANMPNIPGRDSFKGETYHTGHWPHEGVDFTGKRVAVIGTGSSGIQSIPEIAKQAEHLYVFQRTPNFSVPANNRALTEEERNAFKAEYRKHREEALTRQSAILFEQNDRPVEEVPADEQQALLEKYWQLGGLNFLSVFNDLMLTKDANEVVAEFVRGKIAEIVEDPETAKALMPDSVIGCKRLCADSGYFHAFNRDNVTLIDIRDSGVEEITESGVKAKGDLYEVDAIVYATGFDAMTGSLDRIHIVGQGNQTLKEKWSEGPRTYLGLQPAGFPNMFMVTGPGSPSVLTNMIMSIEQHVDFIADTVEYLRGKGLTKIDPEPSAEEEWVGVVNMIADATLFPTCNSWYLGANVPGKPRVFMPFLGYPEYVAFCEEVVANDYKGFQVA